MECFAEVVKTQIQSTLLAKSYILDILLGTIKYIHIYKNLKPVPVCVCCAQCYKNQKHSLLVKFSILLIGSVCVYIYMYIYIYIYRHRYRYIYIYIYIDI